MARKKEKALTEAELFYIQEKSKTESVEDIAAVLNRNVADVAEHVPEHEVVESPKEETHMRRLMGRNTKNTKRSGVAIMTKEASELADTTRQIRVGGKWTDCIHKPLGD